MKWWVVQRAHYAQPLILLALILSLPVASPALEVGEKASDFELRNTTGGKIKLSEFAGKKNALIEFYIMDFHHGRDVAYRTRGRAYARFQATDTEILGISVLGLYG